MGRISVYLKGLVQPDPEQTLTSRLFLSLFSLIYPAAFLSLTIQITGLTGSNGILPFQQLQEQASLQLGCLAWLHIPTLLWFTSSDPALPSWAVGEQPICRPSAALSSGEGLALSFHRHGREKAEWKLVETRVHRRVTTDRTQAYLRFQPVVMPG